MLNEMPQKTNNLSLLKLLPEPHSAWHKIFGKLADKLLGIRHLDYLYQQHQFAGLSAEAFCEKFIEVFKLTSEFTTPLNLPKDKPLVIVANHPFGGLEGVLLTYFLAQQRPDLKVLANQGLSIFSELHEKFIFTNPLKASAKGNVTSLKKCHQHLKSGGALLLFPAGRVSYYQQSTQAISDHRWHRSAAQLIENNQADVLPLYIAGQNRAIFYRLGRIYFRFRLLMLIREMIAAKGKTIRFYAGKIMQHQDLNALSKYNPQQISDRLQLLTYLQNPAYNYPWPVQSTPDLQPLAEPSRKADMHAEVLALSKQNQNLINFKNFVVCYAQGNQIPACLAQIRRLREATFRSWDEGSGAPQDGDDFDYSYTHLFIFDSASEDIVGAYRMGQTDKIDTLYLANMFNFSAQFINQQAPCLEMGRSFVVANQQKSYHALLLLFKGIGRFVCRFPQYKTLYGTVSLSTQYQPLSIKLIESFLIEGPNRSATAICPFEHPAPKALEQFFLVNDKDINTLEWLVKQIEPDGKGLPVLLKQYHQLGAKFHALGLDPNFATTPGLLLSVYLPDAPQKLLKLYLGDDYTRYCHGVTDVHANQQ
ncbi:lysophospholipid acyltransferase family protein [Catenovulum sediminis]|uniref:lysophospholipid acyltransferase family protein n=1 Tax=Catenovulum sediminis TaxID=1740262 RepID=UPI00117F9612|nr:lysophospholipid acyltransferase family protein [Catenovulum sediminis]